MPRFLARFWDSIVLAIVTAGLIATCVAREEASRAWTEFDVELLELRHLTHDAADYVAKLKEVP